MVFKQFYLQCLSQASYLIGDEATQTAVVVDPRRDVDEYIEEADRYGLRIRHIFLTHFHADFVAGHLELRDCLGATIHLGSRARPEYPFVGMQDGAVLEFGTVRLQVLETPGHTPESISILLFDQARDAHRPHAVLTGDTLFVGDVGRPDLRASLGWSATDLGAMLYDSLRTKLMPLPPSTLVYPAHGAGSLCGKSLGKENVTTIGDELRSNYALQPMCKEDFIELVVADQPDAPQYFSYDAVLNAKERPLLEAVLDRELTPLIWEDVFDLTREGAQLLDVRDPDQFAQGHLPGAINVGLGGQYAIWSGTFLASDRPVVIVAPPARHKEAAMRLARIGFDNVEGYLAVATDSRPDLLARTERMQASDLAAAMTAGAAPLVLDVRTAREWRRARIAGSINIPLGQLLDRLDEIPRDRPIVVHCTSGYRSSIAVSVLRAHGFDWVMELKGGISAWEDAQLSVCDQSTQPAVM